MASTSFVWLFMAAVTMVAAQHFDNPEVTTMLATGSITDAPEMLPTVPDGCLTPETHPDCFSASDVTASVIGTFFLTLALVLIIYALHRLCWRVYNVKLANYAI